MECQLNFPLILLAVNFTEIDLRELGLKFAKRRIEKNIAAHALSRILGKNKNYISMVEAGKINVSIKSFMEICQALEIDPRDMF